MAWKKKDSDRDEKRPTLKLHTGAVMILCVCIYLFVLWKDQKEVYAVVDSMRWIYDSFISVLYAFLDFLIFKSDYVRIYDERN